MEIRRHKPTKNSLEYPTGLFRHKNLVCMTYGGYTIFVQYVGVEAKLRMSENLLYDYVQECRSFVLLLPIFNPSLGRREKLPQKVGRKEKLAEKVGRREIYPPVPPPSNSVKLFFCKERFGENSWKV